VNVVQACVCGPKLSLKIDRRWKGEEPITVSCRTTQNQERMTYEQTPEHKAKVKEALTALSTLTPLNLHLRTNATVAQRDDFHSIWHRHTPQAARYYLLPALWRGDLFIIQ
jgi:hypothetical protein